MGGTKENRPVVGAVGAFHRDGKHRQCFEDKYCKMKSDLFCLFFLKQMFLKIKTMALFQSQDWPSYQPGYVTNICEDVTKNFLSCMSTTCTYCLRSSWKCGRISFSFLLLYYLDRITDVHVRSGWSRLLALDGGGLLKEGGVDSSSLCRVLMLI